MLRWKQCQLLGPGVPGLAGRGRMVGGIVGQVTALAHGPQIFRRAMLGRVVEMGYG